MRSDLFLPFLVIEAKEFVNGIVIDVELGQIEIVRAGQPADRRFECAAASFARLSSATALRAPLRMRFSREACFTRRVKYRAATHTSGTTRRATSASSHWR